MTQHTPTKPGEFPLGSVESRAAARAILQQIAKGGSPLKGDILIQLEATGWPDRHGKIIRILDARGRLKSKPERLPGIPIFWLALPEGFDPKDLGNPPQKAPANQPSGSVLAIPISAMDLPFFWKSLTATEQKRLLGQ